MASLEPWKILHTQYLLEKRWLKVRQDRVLTSRGHTIDEFHVLEVPSWACICCISEHDELILTRQYRHGTRKDTLELPAGVIEADETPEAGAARELLEETGYTSSEWLLLALLTPEPVRHTHQAYCYLARNARQTHTQELDASEDVVVDKVPIADAMQLIEQGAISHAVHVAALLLAERRGFLQPTTKG